MNKKLEIFLVIGLVIISLVPFWQWMEGRIPKTHDIDLQIARIASFSQGLREGSVFPRWGGNLNWGYGHPSLMFLYPLSSYIGGLLTLTGLSFVTATKLTFALTAAAAAAGMYIFLRRIFSVWAAAFGTFLYLLAPYRLVDINVRGALGELMGLAVIPWVFWRFWELADNLTRKNIGWAGVSIFLLILAHNALGLMGLGMLGIWLLMMFHFKIQRRSSISIKVIGLSLLLGFGLAAFYWLPAIVEGKYTFQKEFTNLEIYAGRFPAPGELLFSPWGYGGTSENGRPAGFTVAVGWANIVSVAFLILFSAKRKSRHPERSEGSWRDSSSARGGLRMTISVAFLIIFLTAIFFLTPWSLGAVRYLGIIQRFQFPWRWLAVTTVAGAVLGATAFAKASAAKAAIFGGFLGVITVWQAWPGFFINGYEDINPANETFSGSVAWTTDTGESTPRWATRFQDKFPKSQLEVVWGADIDYQVLGRKQELHRYIIDAKVPTQVVDNTLYFPGWKATVNGQEAPIEYQDQNWRGLITFPVPAGRSEVEVEFTMTVVRKAATVISLVSFAMLLAL